MASTNFIQNFAVGLIITIIAISIGATCLKTIQDTQVVNAWDTATNEQITLLNGTNVSLAHTGVNSAVFSMVNSTGGQTVPASNYTLYAAAGKVMLTFNSSWNNTEVNATYQYNYHNTNTSDYNITGKGLTGISTYADFFGVLVVISVLAAIIMLFGMIRRED